MHVLFGCDGLIRYLYNTSVVAKCLTGVVVSASDLFLCYQGFDSVMAPSAQFVRVFSLLTRRNKPLNLVEVS